MGRGARHRGVADPNRRERYAKAAGTPRRRNENRHAGRISRGGAVAERTGFSGNNDLSETAATLWHGAPRGCMPS